MKHESRLGRAASGKTRKSAILGRLHVPAVPKSRNAGAAGMRLCHGAHASRARRSTQAVCHARSSYRCTRQFDLSAGHERSDVPDKILFRSPMFNQRDDRVGPGGRVLNRKVVTVRVEKLHHRHKASALVSLGECCDWAIPASSLTASGTRSSSP
jgi:hypothetical protein